ncbi:hypothetical protein D044_2247 [Vibrio parahaemolyticus EKP-026]|nr:hypothetical protein D044_2247 [Vibrio parahaemolyticus EKP-026]
MLSIKTLSTTLLSEAAAVAEIPNIRGSSIFLFIILLPYLGTVPNQANILNTLHQRDENDSHYQ